MMQGKNKGQKKIKQFLYYAKWFLGQKIGLQKPLVNTMILHLACNLSCEHCDIQKQREKQSINYSLSYLQAEEKMIDLYKRGARIAYFEGGEPTIWQDQEKDLSDLIKKAKEVGYYTTGYTTNGCGKFFLESDVISVSLDGPKEIHDRIRAPGTYQMLMKNLEKINHPNIFANMVITKSNINYIAETVQIVENHPHIKGIMLNFLTPPPFEIGLSLAEKQKAVQLIFALKNQKAPILNTRSALRNLLKEDFSKECPFWLSAFVLPDGSEIYGCPLRSEVSCQNCGFDAVREYALIAKGSIPAIFELSKRFAFSLS